ncbi:hypothetical protein [Streptomyces sp. NPDC050164]|uniref:hypothetical protein n=1 Tax=Streptomyces sp. NPDC050164 TaxID=3365605 RepID=UPI0037882870
MGNRDGGPYDTGSWQPGADDAGEGAQTRHGFGPPPGYCRERRDILVPSLLMIDSPRKAFGNNASDRQRAEQICNRLKTLADAYGDRLQLIIADNDAPPITSEPFSVASDCSV